MGMKLVKNGEVLYDLMGERMRRLVLMDGIRISCDALKGLLKSDKSIFEN